MPLPRPRPLSHARRRCCSLAFAATCLVHAGILATWVQMAGRMPEIITPAEKGPVSIALRVAAPAPEQPEPAPRPAPPREEFPPPESKADPPPPKPAPAPKPAPKPSPAPVYTPDPPKPAERIDASTPANPAPPAPPAPVVQQERTPDASEQEAFVARLMAEVERNKYYPLAAKRAGISGVVQLRVRIDTSGNIRHVELVTSPNATLGDAALATLEKVKGGWSGDGWRGPAFTVQIPMRFEVR